MFSTFHMPSFSMLEPCSVLIHLFVLFANLTHWQCVLLDLLTLVGVVSPPTSVDVNFFYSHVISGGSSKQKPHWSNSVKHEQLVWSRYGVLCHKVALSSGFLLIFIIFLIYRHPICSEHKCMYT